MLAKEFEEKYDMKCEIDEYSRLMFADMFIIESIMIIILCIFLVGKYEFTLINVGICVFWGLFIYLIYISVQMGIRIIYINCSKFIELGIFFKDDSGFYQFKLDDYKKMNKGNWLLVNNQFILDTSAIFGGLHDVKKSIFSFVENKSVISKFGLGKGKSVFLVATYHDEHEIDGIKIPVLMLRLSGPVTRELAT
jgi:uncharacterized membrane protein (UPF0182 family)